MKFSFDQKWVPAAVVLAVTVALVMLNKLPTEQAAGWASALLVALGLESKSDA